MHNNISEPMTLYAFLGLVDHKRLIAVYNWRFHHQVIYGSSREIIKMLPDNPKICAYAYNPGNGIVCIPRNRSTISFAVTFNGFPDSNRNNTFIWSRLKNSEALKIIQENQWLNFFVSEDRNYSDRSYLSEWITEVTGKIECTNRFSSQQYSTCSYDFTVKRLKSGRLRVEVLDSYYPCVDLAQALVFFDEENYPDQLKNENQPELFYGKTITAINGITPQLALEIKAQAVADKLNPS